MFVAAGLSLAGPQFPHRGNPVGVPWWHPQGAQDPRPRDSDGCSVAASPASPTGATAAGLSCSEDTTPGFIHPFVSEQHNTTINPEVIIHFCIFPLKGAFLICLTK